MKGSVPACMRVRNVIDFANERNWEAQSCTTSGFNGRRCRKNGLYGTEIQKMSCVKCG